MGRLRSKKVKNKTRKFKIQNLDLPLAVIDWEVNPRVDFEFCPKDSPKEPCGPLETFNFEF